MKKIVEFNPALEYLAEVLRQMGFHARAWSCEDPMLKPLLERAAEGCGLVRYSPHLLEFRFDPLSSRQRPGRGNQYEYVWGRDSHGREWGYLRQVVRATSYSVLEVEGPYPELPPADRITAQDLLDAVNLLEVQRVME